MVVLGAAAISGGWRCAYGGVAWRGAMTVWCDVAAVASCGDCVPVWSGAMTVSWRGAVAVASCGECVAL